MFNHNTEFKNHWHLPLEEAFFDYSFSSFESDLLQHCLLGLLYGTLAQQRK
jgi:hypothetical protein